MKTFLILTVIFNFIINHSFANDKSIGFITAVGSNYRNAIISAENTAYMNGLKVIGKNTTKSGEIWVTTIKVSKN
jgi:hypothetical protein